MNNSTFGVINAALNVTLGHALNTSLEIDNEDVYTLQDHEWGTDTEDIVSMLMLVFFMVLAVSLILAHYVLHRWHITFMPEAATVLVAGVLFGGLVYLAHGSIANQYLLTFSPTLFFVIFLPPIILNSAYHMKQEFFFTEFGPIMAFGVGGTVISNIIVASLLYGIQATGVFDKGVHYEYAELLTFGGLISATDPVSTIAVFTELKVHPTIFYIVMGESLINDAVGLVLFNTFSKFVGYSHGVMSLLIALLDFCMILGGSMIIGYVAGLLHAFIFRKLSLKENMVIETSVFVIFSYIPFVAAEVVGMSGIVTVMTSGLTIRRYAHGNLSSDESKDAVINVFQISALITESAVFVNLGMTVFHLDEKDVYHPIFITFAILACLIARVFGIYGLSLIMNYTGRRKPLTQRMQFMLWFAGLRGAVAFACASEFPDDNGNRKDMIATTMVIVLFTVFTMGTFTKPLLDCLKIERDIDIETFEKPETVNRVAIWLLGIEERFIIPCVVADINARMDKLDDEPSFHTHTARHGQSQDIVEVDFGSGGTDGGGLHRPSGGSRGDYDGLPELSPGTGKAAGKSKVAPREYEMS